LGDSQRQKEASADLEKTQITEQERKILSILRKLDYGEVRIVVKNFEIVQAEEKKSIKL